MNKKLVVMTFVLVAFLLSALAPWPAVLTVINRSEESVFIKLGSSYFLTTASGDTTHWDITRATYSATVTACNETKSGIMNVKKNLRLVFTSCYQMPQWASPKYWGEPRFEKVNFFNFNDKTGWRYPLPDGLADDVSTAHWWNHIYWRFSY